MNEAEQLTLDLALREEDCPKPDGWKACGQFADCPACHGSGQVPLFPRLRVTCPCSKFIIECADCSPVDHPEGQPCCKCQGQEWYPEPDEYRAYGIIKEVLEEMPIESLIEEAMDGLTSAIEGFAKALAKTRASR